MDEPACAVDSLLLLPMFEDATSRLDEELFALLVVPGSCFLAANRSPIASSDGSPPRAGEVPSDGSLTGKEEVEASVAGTVWSIALDEWDRDSIGAWAASLAGKRSRGPAANASDDCDIVLIKERSVPSPPGLVPSASDALSLPADSEWRRPSLSDSSTATSGAGPATELPFSSLSNFSGF